MSFIYPILWFLSIYLRKKLRNLFKIPQFFSLLILHFLNYR